MTTTWGFQSRIYHEKNHFSIDRKYVMEKRIDDKLFV